MYSELIKRLREAYELSACGDCGYKGDKKGPLLKEAADAIEELSVVVRTQKAVLDKFPRWIPVTERLPVDLTRVIVFCEDGVSYGLCEHLIADDAEVVEWHDFLHYPITPTHWIPLPEPPKEDV